MREDESRGLPYTQAEYRWARSRPPQHRTPLPAVGDEVLYRHDQWGEPVQAEVLHVQSLDDLDDPNLWAVPFDESEPMTLEGRSVIRRVDDPWPLLTLHTAKLGRPQTREARLRGSPGWLPLDWQARYRPVPDYMVMG